MASSGTPRSDAPRGTSEGTPGVPRARSPLAGEVPGRRWTAVVDRGTRVASLLVLVAGLVDLVSALTPAEHGRLRVIVALLGLPAASVAAAGSAVVGVVLVLLARGLRRHKRRAWLLAVPLVALSAVLHLLKGLDVEEAALSVLVLAVLVTGRRRFWAEPDPTGLGRAVVLAGQLLTVSVAAGLLLLQLNAGAVVGRPSVGIRLEHVLLGLVGLAGPVQLAGDRAGDLVSDVLVGLGLVTVAVPLAVALRSQRRDGRLEAADEERLRALLARHGGQDSLGYFALRRDKSVVFSASGKAAVSYRVHAGVVLASGDPVGDPEAWPGAVAAFLDLAARHAWVPAVLGASTRGATGWARAGLSVLEIGDEAVLDVDAFSLEGRAMRGIRQAVGRLERAGYTTSVRRVRDVDPTEMARLRRLADRWRGGPTERGFSMALGRFGDLADGDCVVVTAQHGTGADGDGVAALLHFVPWGDDGLSLDLMRRERTADNGLTELLIVAATRAAPALGVGRISLNFAVFRSALAQGERLGAGPLSRGWRSCLLAASRYWQIETLYRFNAKFLPRWEPRYVCYPRPIDLPRVVVAGLLAEAFLSLPSSSPLTWRGWRPARARRPDPGPETRKAAADTAIHSRPVRTPPRTSVR